MQLTAFRYYGGKAQWLDFILPLFPQDAIHVVDVFGGAGNIAFNLARQTKLGDMPNPHITYNDIDSRLYCFFKILRDSPDELIRAISLSPHCREDFEMAVVWKDWDGVDEIEKARRFFVAITQSINSKGREGRGHWSYSRTRYHIRTPNVNKVVLYEIANLLSRLSIENKPWQDILERYDHEEVVFYLDPPYLPETRKEKSSYKHELSYEDHEVLLQSLAKVKGRCILSGYNNDLYNSILIGWRREDSHAQGSGAAFGDKRVESAWLNFTLDNVELDL